MMELLIAAVALWALCGIPAALIAHRKGRSAVLWAFLGSAFGIFGLATAASLPLHTEGGPWDAAGGDTIHFGSFGNSGGYWDFCGSGSDFGFSDSGGGGGDCGGGGGGGGE